MIVCARCGAQNQPTNKFCLSCGAPVQQPAAAQPGPPAAPAQPPAPQQGYAPHPAPGAWGAPPQPAAPPAPAPQHPGPYGEPPQGWGAPPAAPQQPAPQPQGGFAPAGGFAPSPAPQRFGSAEGMNPFGATVGPNPAQPPQGPQGGYPHQGGPHPGGYGAPSPQQPAPQGHGMQQPAPGWGQSPPQQYPGTQPPPGVPGADYGAPHAHAQPQPAPAPMAPVPAPPSPRPAERPPDAADPERIDPNAARVLAGFLVSYEGNELGVFHPIHQGQTLVGRKGAGAGAAIELEHGTASSRHAVLFASARPGRIKVEDVGSTNGTFVGDLMLERGKRHELKDGDVVRCGGYVTIVKIV
jgi:hypothetical protein